MSVTETHETLGRARGMHGLTDEYESSDAYADQGDTRVVKVLQFAYHTVAPSPMLVGQEVIIEKVAVRNQVVHLDEIGLMYLEKGERLDAFYTTAELEAISDKAAQSSGGGDDAGDEINFTELGTHEMAEYLRENKPNVDDTLKLVENDPDAAKRLLEAEDIVTDNDPRTGIVQGVSKIVGEGR